LGGILAVRRAGHRLNETAVIVRCSMGDFGGKGNRR
jgi:hypothetical protein